MKYHKGDYPGASTFAVFDKPISEMTEAEAKALLNHILFRAMQNNALNAKITFLELEVAEQTAREAGVAI